MPARPPASDLPCLSTMDHLLSLALDASELASTSCRSCPPPLRLPSHVDHRPTLALALSNSHTSDCGLANSREKIDRVPHERTSQRGRQLRSTNSAPTAGSSPRLSYCSGIRSRGGAQSTLGMVGQPSLPYSPYHNSTVQSICSWCSSVQASTFPQFLQWASYQRVWWAAGPGQICLAFHATKTDWTLCGRVGVADRG